MFEAPGTAKAWSKLPIVIALAEMLTTSNIVPSLLLPPAELDVTEKHWPKADPAVSVARSRKSNTGGKVLSSRRGGNREGAQSFALAGDIAATFLVIADHPIDAAGRDGSERVQRR